MFSITLSYLRSQRGGRDEGGHAEDVSRENLGARGRKTRKVKAGSTGGSLKAQDSDSLLLPELGGGNRILSPLFSATLRPILEGKKPRRLQNYDPKWEKKQKMEQTGVSARASLRWNG